MNQKQLKNRLAKNIEKINALRSENYELSKKIIMSFGYSEQLEDVVVSKRPKKVEQQLIGRVNFTQDFVDEDSGEVISVERTQIVSTNGVWDENIINRALKDAGQ